MTAIPDSSGGIVVQFSDITDRKLMEDCTAEIGGEVPQSFSSQAPFPCAIVDIDKNARFLEINDAFERVTGYRRDEIIGRTSTELGLYADLP